MSSRRRSNNNGRRNRRESVNPSSSATIYHGPLRIPIMDGDNGTITTNISLTGNLSTTAAGISQGNNELTDVFGATEWANWASLYQEYRILGFEWSYRPQFADGYVTGGVLTPPQGAVATYHQAGYTPVSSTAELVNNRTFKEFNLARPITMHWKMSGPDESTFQSTTSVSPVSYGGVNWWTDGGTVSALFGRRYVRYLVQFKGRK